MVGTAVRALVAASLSTFVLVAPPASQAVEACSENNQLTFQPPLDALNNMKPGTVTIAFQGSCPDAPGLTPRTYSGSVTTTYFGSCAIAFLGNGGDSVIVGGTAYTFVRGTVQVLGQILQPSGACPIATARGTGVLVSVPEVPGA
jgi:hypothetical protein